MKLLSYGLDHRMEPRLAFSLNGYAVDVMRASLWMKEDRNVTDYLNLASTMTMILKDWDVSLSLLKRLEEALLSIQPESQSIYDRPLAMPLDDIVYFAPVPDPPSIRYFDAFTDNTKRKFSFGNTQTLKGHRQGLIHPGLSCQPEIAAIVAGNKSDPELKIGGYCVVNNWVDSHLISSDSQGLSHGKATTLGPHLVIAEDLEPLRIGRGFNLDLQVSINGDLVRESSLKELKTSFSEMIQIASPTRVQPGDVICSGSPLVATNLPAMKHKDKIDIEIQGMGVLSTSID
mgnify:CR=1 FL=1